MNNQDVPKAQPIKKNKFRWALTIGLLIGTIIVTAFAFFYKLPQIYKYEKESLVQDEGPNREVLSVATTNESSESPYLRTGFDNIFFSINNKTDKNGNVESKVSYYRYGKNKFSKLKPADKIKVTLSKGDEKALVSIDYLEIDGRIEGYGVYQNPKSLSFPYAFIKLTKNTLSKDDFDYLLYVDYSIDDFYRNSKTYSMIYALDTQNKEFQKVFSDKGCPVAVDEQIDDSFILIPSDITGKPADALYFLSDRDYAPGTAYDLYKKSSINSSEEIVAQGISSPNLFIINNKVCFLRESDSKENFDLCQLSDDGEKVLKTFSGSPIQYIFNGKYMFNPSSKALYNLENGSSKSINTTLSISAVQDFDVNSDGTKLAIAGNFAGNSEKLLFIDYAKHRFNILDNSKLFISGHSNIRFLDSSVFFVAPSESKDKVSNLVFSWDAIFSLH